MSIQTPIGRFRHSEHGALEDSPREEEGRGLFEHWTSGEVSNDTDTPEFSDETDFGFGRLLIMRRKTGTILKDTGIRDENGMEPLDGIFSSPEKSLPKRNGVKHDPTITEDETMDVGESNGSCELVAAHSVAESSLTQYHLIQVLYRNLQKC